MKHFHKVPSDHELTSGFPRASSRSM